MPKELHEITKFTAGTITVPDVKDISEDAASYSLNIDSVTASGKLQGVPADTVLQRDGRYGSGANATVDMDVSSIISFNGQNDVIYYEADTNKIHNIIDLYPNIAAGTTYAAVGADDTFTDSSSSFITDGINLTTGGNTPNKITVGGFDDADNNGAFLISSIVAGTITTTAGVHALGNEPAGDDVTISTLVQTDMGAIVSGDDEVTMQVHNKEVHIGAGKGSTDVPKWVGYVDHKQFGTAQTSIPQMEDAELKKPGTFPQIYNAVTVGSYIYGIQYGGSRIYRFSTTSFDSASYTQFVSTQGICLVAAGTDIWLYDDNASFGTLYKIDVSDWGTEDEISQENPISGWGGTSLDSSFEISDIYDSNRIWFAAYKSGHIANASNWLYNSDSIPTSNGALATTKRTPRLEQGADSGDWINNVDVNLYKQCLVGGSNFDVGVVCYFSSSNATRTLYVSPPSFATYQQGLAMFSVEYNYTDKAELSISSGDLAGVISCQIHEIQTGGSASDYGGTDYFGGFFQDGVRLIYSKKNGSDDSELFAWEDIAQAVISSGAQAAAADGTAKGNSDSDIGSAIDANGLAFAVKSDRTALYMFEQYGGGGYITLVYTGTAFSTRAYKERSDFRVTFSSTGTGSFQDDETYFWKFSFMYDEYQESPLSTHFTYTPANGKNIQLDIDLYNLSNIPKRASHLMIYRAQNDDAADEATPETFYRLVKKAKLDSSFALTENGWGGAEDFRRKIFIDQLNNIGASYEARTLMPETLETSIVNYALSTQINSQHIVGKCYKTEVSDPMNYLFKSKVNNFDQFDWTTDFLRLPMTPTALASFNGRIYAFDENNTYRINPQGFYIEDVFNGVGCFGPKSVLVTEYGMCYCDKNNIYLHDGKSPKPIGMQILTGDSSYSWHNIDTDLTPSVMFDSKRKSFMIFFKSSDGSGTRMAWSYNIIFNRWDMLNVGTVDPKGFLHGKNGEMFISYSNVLTKFLGSTSTTLDAWEWQSKYMTMNEDTVKKKFYDINVVTGGTAPNVLYGVDGDTTPADDPTSESGTSNYKGKIQSTHSKSKSLQIKLVQVAGATHNVDSVGVLYRRLPKTSGNI